MKYFLYIALLLNTFQFGDAWFRSNFSINSKLPKTCGSTRRFFPESYFELWGTWPWLGLLFFNGTGNFRCNVVLIHQEAVLTSLDCIRHIPEIDIKYHLYIAFSTPGQRDFQNISVTHVDFAGKSYNSQRDLALMKLSRPVIVSRAVQPICMWEEHHDYSSQLGGHIAFIIGSDFENVYNFQELRVYQTPVRVLSEERCQKIDNRTYHLRIKPEICYTYIKEPKECHAIGSTMMVPRLSEDGEVLWYVRGVIIKRNYFCDRIPLISAFDIGKHRQWIESHFKPSTEDQCGRRKISHIKLVYFGSKIERGDWPWHAALFYRNSYRCGATIISPTTLLTAAHCLYTNAIIPIDTSRLTVKLGKHNLETDEPSSTDMKISSVEIHPEYNTSNLRNDIAVLKVEQPIIYNDFIQPACLWDENSIKKEDIFYKIASVVGWGVTENMTTSDELLLAEVPIADDTLCTQSRPMFYNNFLSDKSFCAGNPYDNATNVCNGDSGGGLMIPQGQDDLEESWFLRGIVSVTVPIEGTRRCDPTKFTIYTDVAQYLPWIKEQMNKNITSSDVNVKDIR